MTQIPVFDGHNDVLLRLYLSDSKNKVSGFINGGEGGHIDLPMAKEGSLVGGMFAMFSPSSEKPLNFGLAMKGGSYNIPKPARLSQEDARNPVVSQLSTLSKIVAESNGQVVVCLTTNEIRETIKQGKFAILLHLEGADSIDGNLDFLDVLYANGLRSIGPVWSRDNIFGSGIPYVFPSSPDIGEGLTSLGEDLVRKCNDLKIVVDLAHQTEKGFWDVARITNAPLVATHANAHALCPSPRNLTDRQLAAVKDSGGIVGLNFATSFLRADGEMRPDTPMKLLVDQIDYLLEKLGEDCLGMGSDYDGAQVPEAVGPVSKLQTLFDALRAKGYSEELLNKLGSKNWLSVLERTIG